MDKYLTFAGLQPVYLGDIDFLQDAMRDALSLTLQGLTGEEKPKCILAYPTQDKDGVICVDGEIMPYRYVQKDFYGVTGIKVMSEYAGERTFKDGEGHACYEIRYAQEVVSSSDDPYNLTKFKDISKVLATRGYYSARKQNVRADEISVTFIFIPLGSNRYQVEVAFEQEIDQAIAINQLIAGASVNLPGEFAGTYYCVLSADIGGSLKLLPAKVECVYESSQSCKATVTIPQTQLSLGSKGTLSFTITK